MVGNRRGVRRTNNSPFLPRRYGRASVGNRPPTGTSQITTPTAAVSPLDQGENSTVEATSSNVPTEQNSVATNSNAIPLPIRPGRPVPTAAQDQALETLRANIAEAQSHGTRFVPNLHEEMNRATRPSRRRRLYGPDDHPAVLPGNPPTQPGNQPYQPATASASGPSHQGRQPAPPRRPKLYSEGARVAQRQAIEMSAAKRNDMEYLRRQRQAAESRKREAEANAKEEHDSAQEDDPAEHRRKRVKVEHEDPDDADDES